MQDLSALLQRLSLPHPGANALWSCGLGGRGEVSRSTRRRQWCSMKKIRHPFVAAGGAVRMRSDDIWNHGVAQHRGQRSSRREWSSSLQAAGAAVELIGPHHIRIIPTPPAFPIDENSTELTLTAVTGPSNCPWHRAKSPHAVPRLRDLVSWFTVCTAKVRDTCCQEIRLSDWCSELQPMLMMLYIACFGR